MNALRPVALTAAVLALASAAAVQPPAPPPPLRLAGSMDLPSQSPAPPPGGLQQLQTQRAPDTSSVAPNVPPEGLDLTGGATAPRLPPSGLLPARGTPLHYGGAILAIPFATVTCRTPTSVCSFQVQSPEPPGSPCYCDDVAGTSQ